MSAVVEVTPKHTITALVQNETGTINRLVSLFRRRGFSLECFNAGDCEIPGFSRLTLVVNGDRAALVQCIKQLEKLIDVVEVEDLDHHESVEVELVLVRISPVPGGILALEQELEKKGARISKQTQLFTVVEFVGCIDDVNRFIKDMAKYTVSEIVRTGVVAMKVSESKQESKS